jgi:hypothetical protein
MLRNERIQPARGINEHSMIDRRLILTALTSMPALAWSAGPANAITVTGNTQILVHKTASCQCCGFWVEHLQSAGFEVEARNVDDLPSIKQRLGVPAELGSCHTAEAGGYFVEGHVPASDVRRLLKERPKAKGIAVPGMPAGSPGMEVPSGHQDPYDVLLVGKDGAVSVFARHRP